MKKTHNDADGRVPLFAYGVRGTRTTSEQRANTVRTPYEQDRTGGLGREPCQRPLPPRRHAGAAAGGEGAPHEPLPAPEDPRATPPAAAAPGRRNIFFLRV